MYNDEASALVYSEFFFYVHISTGSNTNSIRSQILYKLCISVYLKKNSINYIFTTTRNVYDAIELETN